MNSISIVYGIICNFIACINWLRHAKYFVFISLLYTPILGHVCTYLNTFSMVIPNIVMKFNDFQNVVKYLIFGMLTQLPH